MTEPLPPHLDPRGRHRGNGGATLRAGFHSARPVGRVLLAIVSISLLVVAGYYWYTYRDLDKGLNRVRVTVGGGQPGDAPDIDGKDLNILVVGNDDRETMSDAEAKELHAGKDGGSLATDTMMIVHVPADGSKATLISLPRDTMVDIPDGYRRNKLNSAYGSAYVDAQAQGGNLNDWRAAGANLLLKTITNLTGLTINHYVQVDLLGFYRISKAIGGVPVNLCHAVDDRIRTNRANGISGGSGLKLSAGKHDLSGVEALEFVRQRHGLPRGDLDRVRRQQYFLTSAFRQVSSIGILTKLQSLGDALHRSVYFDESLKLFDLAKQLQDLTANNIVGKTIPTYTDANGNLTAKPAKVRKFVDRLISPASASPSPSASSSASSPNGDSTPSTSSSASPSGSATTSSAPLDAKCIN